MAKYRTTTPEEWKNHLKAVEGEPITKDNPLDQTVFDKRYGFGPGSSDNTKSCQTVALINTYARSVDGGISMEMLDKIYAAWMIDPLKPLLKSDGSPASNLNDMSEALAKVLRMDRYLAIPDDASRISVADFNNTPGIFGIGVLQNDLGPHFVSVQSGTPGWVDSLNPNRISSGGERVEIGVIPFEYRLVDKYKRAANGKRYDE